MSEYAGIIFFVVAALSTFLGGLAFGVWHLGRRNWTQDALRATKVLNAMEVGRERVVWERELVDSLTKIAEGVREDRRARREGKRFMLSAIGVVVLTFVGVLWLNTQLADRSVVPPEAAPIPEPYVHIAVIHGVASLTVCVYASMVYRARRRRRYKSVIPIDMT